MASTVLEQLFTAYNAHDLPTIARLYAPDGYHEEIAFGRVKKGGSEISAGIGYLLGSFPDATWTVEGVIQDSESVACRYRLDATLESDFAEFSAKGQRISIRGVIVISHGEDGITASADYWDAATLRRQLLDQS